MRQGLLSHYKTEVLNHEQDNYYSYRQGQGRYYCNLCTYLAEHKINILDIDQSIIQGYFHMMMIVDANGADKEFASLVKDLEKIGEDLGVQIKMQHEEIFDIMHRI